MALNGFIISFQLGRDQVIAEMMGILELIRGGALQ
jgi:hypothetical protein